MSVNHQIDGGSGEVMGSGDGDGDGDGGRERNLQKKAIGYGRKAKRVVISRIKRAKRQLLRIKRKDNRDSGSGGGCCLYIRRIPSRDSSSKSPTSDPNSSGFDFDSLRGLIEKSDFLLSECNTHLDVYSSDDDIDHDDDDDDDDDDG